MNIKSFFLFFVGFLFTGQVMADDSFSIEELLNTGLPLVQIETVDGVLPTCDFVSAPEGCWGSGITNKTKVPSRMTIQKGTEMIYDSGDYVKDKSGLTIAIRGNSSAYSAKKPYKLKLQKKADLLMRGDDKTYKDKQWLLLKDDWSISLCSMIGWKVGELVGLQWTPKFQFVNVTINGDYKGVYMLAEAVKEKAGRLDIDVDSGYIIEYDAYWWNEDLSLDQGAYYSYAPMRYTFKYPDSEDITNEQLDYIQQNINNVEAAIADGTYPDYIDIESFATWLLTHDILGTADNGGSNIYLTKYDNTEDSKLTMANLWDLDTIMKIEDSWATIHIMRGYYFYWLFLNDNKAFAKAYVDKWNELSPTFVNQISSFLDDFAASDEAKALDLSRTLDGQRWNIVSRNVENEVEAAKTWFTNRKTWLDEHVAEIDLSTDINKLTSKKEASSQPVYHLSGYRMPSGSVNGIMVKNGKKYIHK